MRHGRLQGRELELVEEFWTTVEDLAQGRHHGVVPGAPGAVLVHLRPHEVAGADVLVLVLDEAVRPVEELGEPLQLGVVLGEVVPEHADRSADAT
ncbi:hypothetical protein EDM37_14410 [Staphylococcus aureus]|nr:hypothetical protein EDM37_14410 [Staphylococcus aureus]